MAEISKITLPSGNTYDIKDATAREMISGGVSFIIAWDGSAAPTVANIPAGVVVKYNGTSYTGTLAADSAEAGAFYLVKSSTAPSSETLDVYDEYVPVGTTGSKTWEKIGDTQLNLTDVVTGVTLTKQTDVVLGEGTTFTNASSSVTFGTPTKDTFVKSVSAETGKNLVTTSITPTNGTESVSKVTKTASKLVTTTVPNVTGNSSVSIPNVTGNTSVSASKISSNPSVTANKSTWTFEMGSGTAAETLIIGGGNGSNVTATNTAYSDVTATNTTLGTNLTATNTTLGTAKTVATGAVDANGAGSDIVTGVTISDKTVAKAGSAVTVATGATSTTGTGDAVVTGVTVGDSAQAITALPTATAAAQTITVGTNDKVTVLKSNTDVSVTKGNA